MAGIVTTVQCPKCGAPAEYFTDLDAYACPGMLEGKPCGWTATPSDVERETAESRKREVVRLREQARDMANRARTLAATKGAEEADQKRAEWTYALLELKPIVEQPDLPAEVAKAWADLWVMVAGTNGTEATPSVLCLWQQWKGGAIPEAYYGDVLARWIYNHAPCVREYHAVRGRKAAAQAQAARQKTVENLTQITAAGGFLATAPVWATGALMVADYGYGIDLPTGDGSLHVYLVRAPLQQEDGCPASDSVQFAAWLPAGVEPHDLLLDRADEPAATPLRMRIRTVLAKYQQDKMKAAEEKRAQKALHARQVQHLGEALYNGRLWAEPDEEAAEGWREGSIRNCDPIGALEKHLLGDTRRVPGRWYAKHHPAKAPSVERVSVEAYRKLRPILKGIEDRARILADVLHEELPPDTPEAEDYTMQLERTGFKLWTVDAEDEECLGPVEEDMPHHFYAVSIRVVIGTLVVTLEDIMLA